MGETFRILENGSLAEQRWSQKTLFKPTETFQHINLLLPAKCEKRIHRGRSSWNAKSLETAYEENISYFRTRLLALGEEGTHCVDKILNIQDFADKILKTQDFGGKNWKIQNFAGKIFKMHDLDHEFSRYCNSPCDNSLF